MLPEIVLCLDTRSQDCTYSTIKDESEYSVDGADARNAHAQYLLPFKMDENQTLTFIEGVSNATPLALLEWTFTNKGIGAYRFAYLIISFWNGGTPYVKETVVNSVITVYSDVVYVNGVVYKAIENSTNVEPGVTAGWELSWSIVTDLTTLINHVNKDSIIVHIHDDIVTCEYEACLADMLDDYSEVVLKGLCDSLEKIAPVLKAQLLLEAAESNNWQDKQTRSEVILTEGYKKFCNAC